MARRYWVHRENADDDAEAVAGPFETLSAAHECVQALEDETDRSYKTQPTG